MLSKTLKYLSIFFILLFSFSIVSALSTTGNTNYWTFDNTLSDSIGGKTFTNNGATYTLSGKINGSYDYVDTESDYMSAAITSTTNDYTYNMWFKFDDTSTHQRPFWFYGSTGDQVGIEIVGNTLYATHKISGGTKQASLSFSNTTGFHMVTMSKDSSGNLNLYIDAGTPGSNTGAGSTMAGVVTFNIGRSSQPFGYFNGKIDELGIWNRVLNSSEISELYNNDVGCQYDYTNCVPSIPSINFQEVKLNNETNFNNTFYNSTPQLLEVTLNTTDPNNNTNVTLYLYNSTNDLITTNQFITNNLTGSYNISFPYEDTFQFYLYAFNNETNATIGNYTISYDVSPPTINNTLPSEINTYNINVSNYVSCDEATTCNITFIEDNITLLNTNTSYYFPTNGNKTYSILAKDNAGNSVYENGFLLVNPSFTVDFINSSNVSVIDYTLNGVSYNSSFTGLTYDYGLGNHTFNWSKTGYEDFNFTLEFNSTSNINQSIQVDPADLTILIENVDTGNLTTPGNFTILINFGDTGVTEEYHVVNNNTLIIPNILEIQTELAISIIQNESIISSVSVVDPRQDVTIDLYVTDRVTVDRQFEALNPSLSVIPNSYVYLYIFIPGEGFVLQSQKRTNGVGEVTFPIIENVKTYNICNTYQAKEKCLSQVIFTNILTDPNQIIHDPDLTATTKEILDFISWSYMENKTNVSSEMTFIFDDERRIVSQFCMNITRTTNRSSMEELGAFCIDSYGGNVVQTFSLGQDQYIDYTFQYVYNNETTILNSIRSYYEVVDFTELKNNSVFDLLFLFIYFGAISMLLRFMNFEWYNIGLLIVMLVIFLAQAVISENYINIGVWGFMAIKTLALYTVRYGD